MNDKYVFISYSSAEYTEAALVRNVLTENGIKCWMAPDSIPVGSSYATEINVAIENCGIFVLVLSEKAQNSAWVEKELDSAITRHKIVYPFMIENCQLNDAFDFYLTNVQRHSAFESKSVAMERMVKEIKAIFGITTTEKTDAPKLENEGVKQEVQMPVTEKPKQESPSPADGTKLERTKNGAKKLRSFLYKLTPYSRKNLQDKNARFALTVSTVFWALIMLPMISVLMLDADYYQVIPNFIKVVILVLLAFVTWHVSAMISGWISKIPIKNKILHHLVVFVICTVITMLVTVFISGVAYAFIESISDDIYYSVIYG